jgi:hypothetical protein
LLALFVHDDAKADLKALLRRSPTAAAKIAAVLEQLRADEDLLDRLTQQDYGANQSEAFHVTQWFEQQRAGRNLWRLKVWELEDMGRKYRVVYAFKPREKHLYILGVVPREEFDYDQDSFSQRIISAYDKLR